VSAPEGQYVLAQINSDKKMVHLDRRGTYELVSGKEFVVMTFCKGVARVKNVSTARKIEGK
jgi:hypothetical protein